MTSTDVPTCTPVCPGAESPQVRTAALLWLILLLDLVWPFQAGLTHALGHKPRSGQGIHRLAQTKFQMRQHRGWPGKVWCLHFPHLGPCPSWTPKAATCCPVTPQTSGRGRGRVSRWPQIAYSWAHVPNRDVVLVMNFASSWKQLPSPPGWPLLPFTRGQSGFLWPWPLRASGGRVGGGVPKRAQGSPLAVEGRKTEVKVLQDQPLLQALKSQLPGVAGHLGATSPLGGGGPASRGPSPCLCVLFSQRNTSLDMRATHLG